MNDRSVSWVDTISEEIENSGPLEFSLQRLSQQSNLFAHRSALFYTPTKNIPTEYIGQGLLDITLPITSPDFIDFREIRAYMMPRFWVDLIQRQTHMIRWEPMPLAKVTFERFDYFKIRQDHLATGTKALTDALKVRSYGRGDGKCLNYFGAIADDSPTHIATYWNQQTVDHPRDSRIRILVERVDKL